MCLTFLDFEKYFLLSTVKFTPTKRQLPLCISVFRYKRDWPAENHIVDWHNDKTDRAVLKRKLWIDRHIPCEHSPQKLCSIVVWNLTGLFSVLTLKSNWKWLTTQEFFQNNHNKETIIQANYIETTIIRCILTSYFALIDIWQHVILELMTVHDNQEIERSTKDKTAPSVFLSK